MKKRLHDYCVGCGLCQSMKQATLGINDKGYLYPVSGNIKWLSQICPCEGKQQKEMDFDNIWGRTKKVYYGWSMNDKIRSIASSGGVLTEIAAFLLESQIVDAIIHVCADPNDPTRTICCISNCTDQLISRCGSRYSISHPLSNISEIDLKKRYAFIGKPCDIVSLKNFMKIDVSISKAIIYTLSFFCAGLPSVDSQKKLLDELGCKKEECISLRYRGDGWPGYTTAIDKKNNKYQLNYGTSWGRILGRDIMKMCRFCLDGIGEMADISCGDAWYLTKDNKPSFEESVGRNIIFARSNMGLDLIEIMAQEEKIHIEETDTDILKYIQEYQYNRRASMLDKLLAMKLFGKSIPKYSFRRMFKYWSKMSIKKHYDIFIGTCKRIIKGKIL